MEYLNLVLTKCARRSRVFCHRIFLKLVTKLKWLKLVYTNGVLKFSDQMHETLSRISSSHIYSLYWCILFAPVFIHLCIYLFMSRWMHLCMHLFMYLFMYLFVYLFMYLFMYLFVYLFMYLFMCLCSNTRGTVLQHSSLTHVHINRQYTHTPHTHTHIYTDKLAHSKPVVSLTHKQT